MFKIFNKKSVFLFTNHIFFLIPLLNAISKKHTADKQNEDALLFPEFTWFLIVFIGLAMHSVHTSTEAV